jgi:hypothetical protein
VRRCFIFLHYLSKSSDLFPHCTHFGMVSSTSLNIYIITQCAQPLLVEGLEELDDSLALEVLSTRVLN